MATAEFTAEELALAQVSYTMRSSEYLTVGITRCIRLRGDAAGTANRLLKLLQDRC